MFRLPSELQAKNYFLDFNISPSGRPHVLTETRDGLNVLDFKSDGSLGSLVRLGAADNLEGKIAVFDSGVILFSGYFVENAPADVRGKNYIALFDSPGKLLRQLGQSLGGKEAAKSKGEITVQDVGGSPLSIGDDGYVYALQGEKVLVISQSGELVKRLSYKKPTKEAFPTRIMESGGLIALVFSAFEKDHHHFSNQYVLIDSNTGETHALYTASPELGKEVVCFSRNDGFTFLRWDKAEHLKRITAEIR